MDQNLAARLAALPRLSREAAVAAAIPCKICRRPAGFFDVVDVQNASAVIRSALRGSTRTGIVAITATFYSRRSSTIGRMRSSRNSSITTIMF